MGDPRTPELTSALCTVHLADVVSSAQRVPIIFFARPWPRGCRYGAEGQDLISPIKPFSESNRLGNNDLSESCRHSFRFTKLKNKKKM